MKIRARAQQVLNLAKRFELLWKVFTDGPEVSLAAFDTADAVRVVVAKSVHEGEFDACSFDHRLAVFFPQAAINQRGDYRAIRVPLPESIQPILLFSGIAKDHDVSWLLPGIQQPGLSSLVQGAPY